MQNTDFLIEPSTAKAILDQKNILIIDLCKAEVYQQHHLPGAINLSYKDIIHGIQPTPGKLPSVHRLQTLFNAIGLSPQIPVLIYDDEGSSKACRFIWTLDVIGHNPYYLLNGGIHSWVNEGYPTSSISVRPKPAKATLQLNDGPIADKNYLLKILHNKDYIILDVRSEEEYRGQRGGNRFGHIPGALNLDWLNAINRDNHMRLYPDKHLQANFDAIGLNKEEQIITYCFTHHRSAHTYAVLKHLGYPRVKGYAGSWAEWSSDINLPIE